MKYLFWGLIVFAFVACGGGGGGNEAGPPNPGGMNNTGNSLEFPESIARLPMQLETFSPSDLAQDILYSDLWELAGALSVPEAINAYNVIPYESSANGCTYISNGSRGYYISISCGDVEYTVEGLYSDDWLTLWIDDWQSGSRIYHKYVYKPESDSILYIEKDYRGSATQVEEALFYLGDGAVTTEYHISYVE